MAPNSKLAVSLITLSPEATFETMNNTLDHEDDDVEPSPCLPQKNVYDRRMMRRGSNQSLKSMASNRSARSNRSNRSNLSTMSNRSNRSNQSFQHGQRKECDGSTILRALVDEMGQMKAASSNRSVRSTRSTRSNRSVRSNRSQNLNDDDDTASRRSRILQARREENASSSLSNLPRRLQVQHVDDDAESDNVSVLSENSSSDEEADSRPAPQHKSKNKPPVTSLFIQNVTNKESEPAAPAAPPARYSRFVKPSAALQEEKTPPKKTLTPTRSRPAPSMEHMAELMAILGPDVKPEEILGDAAQSPTTNEITPTRSALQPSKQHPVKMRPFSARVPVELEGEDDDDSLSSSDASDDPSKSGSSRHIASEEAAGATPAVDTTGMEQCDHNHDNDDGSWDESDSSSEGSDLEQLLQDLPDANRLLQELNGDPRTRPN